MFGDTKYVLKLCLVRKRCLVNYVTWRSHIHVYNVILVKNVIDYYNFI
jgi:hypothetical protein